MNANYALKIRSRPRLLDLALVVIGLTLLGVGFDYFRDSLFFSGIGFAAGCVLAALAWLWPRVAAPGLLVLSIPGMFYALFLTYYTGGVPQAVVGLWGSAAFLAGAVGILHRRSAARRPARYFVIGALAVVFLFYFLLMWPPRGRAILLSLPIMSGAGAPQARMEAGGVWAAYWTPARVTLQEELESVTPALEADGWTIVDSSLEGFGMPIVSAQRGAYSLEVIYDPDPPGRPTSMGAYMAVYVRRARARTFPVFQSGGTAQATRVKGGKQ